MGDIPKHTPDADGIKFSTRLALRLVGEAISKGEQQFVIVDKDDKFLNNGEAVSILESWVKEGKEFVPTGTD